MCVEHLEKCRRQYNKTQGHATSLDRTLFGHIAEFSVNQLHEHFSSVYYKSMLIYSFTSSTGEKMRPH